jgi:hypothetical protein
VYRPTPLKSVESAVLRLIRNGTEIRSDNDRLTGTKLPPVQLHGTNQTVSKLYSRRPHRKGSPTQSVSNINSDRRQYTHVWVVRIIDDHWTTQAVAVLCPKVRMVPECTRLTGSGEVIQKRMSWSNRALIHEGGSVGPIGAFLEHSVLKLGKSCH